MLYMLCTVVVVIGPITITYLVIVQLYSGMHRILLLWILVILHSTYVLTAATL